MIYAEFIDWDRRMPVELFRHQSRQDNWAEGADTKTINIGRHKGIGPRPAYLCCWRIAGMARLDEWEELFKSPAGRRDIAEHATFQALDFRECGLYDELVAGALPDGNLHFLERFDAGQDVEDEELEAHFRERAARCAGASLSFLLRRVGLLGPRDGDLAIWTAPSFAALEPLARERHAPGPFRPVAAGIYRNVGHELM